MPIVANGVTITDLVVNGVTVTEAWANGTQVFVVTAQTDDPSMALSATLTKTIKVNFTNNDASDATLYADVSQATPTTNQGVVGAGQTLEVSWAQLEKSTAYTFYAYMQASGEDPSNIISDTYST